MDNGMWVLGLIIVLFFIFILQIFLSLKFISFLINKTKKNKADNEVITMDYKIKEEEVIKLKEKTKLYKIFIVFSILICIFLPHFVNNMTSKFPNAYPGNEASSGIITSKISSEIAIFVWPILIIYLSMLITLIVKKTNYRKVYYPLSLFTVVIILFNLGIIYSGYMILWYAIFLIYPIITLIILLAIIGSKLDNNTISKKAVGIIFGCVLIIPMLILALNFVEYKVKNAEYNYEILEEQEDEYEKKEEQNKIYEKKKNEIKEEFNNLINSDFISINDLELSEDYSTIKNIELLISNDNVFNNSILNNEIDFCNELIKVFNSIKVLLNKYNYDSQNIDFEFTNKNPFAKENSTAYKDRGYIGDYGSVYFIYLNPSPVKISK